MKRSNLLKVWLPIIGSSLVLVGTTTTLVSCTSETKKPTIVPKDPITEAPTGDIELTNAYACYAAWANGGYDSIVAYVNKGTSAKVMAEYIETKNNLSKTLSFSSPTTTPNKVFQYAKDLKAHTTTGPAQWELLDKSQCANQTKVTVNGTVITVEFDKPVIGIERAYKIGGLYNASYWAEYNGWNTTKAIENYNGALKQYEQSKGIISLNTERTILTINCQNA